MINVNGVTKVTKLEVNEKYTKGSLYESYKVPTFKEVDEFTWETEFINCVFVGEAHKMIQVFPNKTKINIISAIFRMEKNKYPKVVINKIEIVEEKEVF